MRNHRRDRRFCPLVDALEARRPLSMAVGAVVEVVEVDEGQSWTIDEGQHPGNGQPPPPLPRLRR
jgi:hypothetical protein